MTNYMTNNNGKLPGAGALDPAKYINDTGEDPDGNKYKLEVVACGATSGECPNAKSKLARTKIENNQTVSDGTSMRDDGTKVVVVTNATCSDGVVKYAKSKRAFAIYGELESGNGTYCNSSS